MKLNMKIQNIKSIGILEISLPVDKGLYAITGQNGSGKSTIITCASSAYYNMQMNEFFGKTNDDAYIEFELNGSKKQWKKVQGRWQKFFVGNFQLTGFYEGSIIFGNRFRNTKYDLLMRLDRINDSILRTASEFVRTNLGKILHNNANFYDKLFCLNSREAGNIVRFDGDIFYYQKGTRRVSQFHMSTGENLLISVLNSIDRRNQDRRDLLVPCLLLLDEIELALHPSSLKRLLVFLQEVSNRYNYAVYFSTHAIELISSINPENIFFIERHIDDSIEILNPCYPAYATRILYDHNGYDYIIMVEDDLAREIVRRILKDNSLINNKLVHVLPCGGFTNVIDLAQEVISSNLTGKISKISIILDRDIKSDAEDYIARHSISNSIPLNFLPIESLEKYLKNKLVDNVDHIFFRKLNDLVFHQKSINQIVEDYSARYDKLKDKSGKKLYELIDEELRNRGRNRNEIIEIVLTYLLENRVKEFDSLIEFLKQTLI